jgi:hypothetical protein
MSYDGDFSEAWNIVHALNELAYELERIADALEGKNEKQN